MAVSIACIVHGESDDRGQPHLALVTHTMDVRNWLPAFLAAFEHDVADDRRLSEELRRAPTGAEDADIFLNDVFISVRAFVNTERGELGQTVRTRAAQDQLQQFFQTSMGALPEKSRLAALGGVRDAATTIGQGGLPVFKAIDSTRRDLTGSFAFDTGLLTADLQALQVGLQNMESNLQTQFNGQLAELESDLSSQIAVKADRAGLDALTTTTVALRRDLDLKADRTIVEGLNTRIDRDLGMLVTRVNRIDERLR
jgi:hypothetical protein